ncbi:hypothetical protein NE235_02340 [Actinoallomurus spadix]|uniref:beta/gamma crystallin domain-containing protein n=1 Tax=Actinoallomurus spadix TaxID=79912 RepID=UPI0020929C93|nr:beta/gamma crystallin domain-containing protein [Actinoallomurus spadix]MCO5984941.1 hypothetical protein [Actinoallomurus spadix]
MDCGDRADLVHIWAHAAHHQNDRYEICLANAGFVGYQYWTDEFYTGNNGVTIHDANGATFTLEKWTDYHPTNAFALDYFTNP